MLVRIESCWRINLHISIFFSCPMREDIVPFNLLAKKEITYNKLHSYNSSGIGPSSIFLSKAIISSCDNWPISWGIDPVNWFAWRLSVFNFFKCPIVLEMVPEKWLKLRSKCFKWFNLCNSDGNEPMSWFELKSKVSWKIYCTKYLV